MKSPDARPGTPPGTDGLHAAGPAPVPAISRTGWRGALSRWWAFARSAYANRVAAAAWSRNHRFFPHPARAAQADPAPSPAPRGVTVRRG